MYKVFDTPASGYAPGQASKFGVWADTAFVSSFYVLPAGCDFGPYRLNDSDVQYVVVAGRGRLLTFRDEAFSADEYYAPNPVAKVEPTPKPSQVHARADESLPIRSGHAFAVRAARFHALAAEDEDLILLVTHSSLHLLSDFVAR